MRVAGMRTRRVIALCALLLTGCASLPDPSDCRAYGVEERQEYQPTWTRCDTVTEVALSKRDVWGRCHAWGCVLRQGKGDGLVHCVVYWYEKDRYVLNHERCHVEHGPAHVQPLHWTELFDG